MRKKNLLVMAGVFFFMAFVTPLIAVTATADVEIDVPAILASSEAIFLAGIGGLSVTALVSVIKRWLKAQGVAVIAISVAVSAAAVLIYLIPAGFVLWKFLVYTVLVTLAANGIYLFPRKRT